MKELRTVLPYLRPYRAGILFGFLLIVISNGFGILVPELIGRGIDAPTRAGATRGTVAFYAALIIGATMLSGAARFGMRQLLNGISRRVEVDLRDAFTDHLLRLDATFFGRHRTGDLMSRATNDILQVRQAAGPGVMYLVNTLTLSAFCLARMIATSPALTALTLMPLVLLPPIVLRFGQRIHEKSEAIQDHLGTLSNFVQENLSAVRIVRAYVQERAQEREFDELNAGYRHRNMALARTSALFHPLIALLAGVSMVLLLWFGGRLIVAGEITAGDFVAFGFYLGLLTWPMIALGWVTDLFQRGAAAMKRINRVLATQPAVAAASQPILLPEVGGRIEFRDVGFRYPDAERDVLGGVSFDVPAGSTVAIVGPTGAGKSTIVALLARLYDPIAGDVLLDGVPLPQLQLAQLRAAIAVVPQDAFVFSETIEENIALGLDAEDTAARVREAAQVARLDATVRSFPDGYATRLGERGVNLSGGQRQRATLARALARDPRVLVLDDALSAVDTHTETEILDALRDVLRARTALIVSHRVTAVMNADQILVLDEGRIVERGTHAGLVSRGGVYAELLRRQLLEEDLERGDALAGADAAR